MLIRKLFNRSKTAATPAAKTADSAQSKPANLPEQAYQERRRFTRPLPVAEVHEQDWSAWMDLTDDQKPSQGK